MILLLSTPDKKASCLDTLKLPRLSELPHSGVSVQIIIIIDYKVFFLYENYYYRSSEKKKSCHPIRIQLVSIYYH